LYVTNRARRANLRCSGCGKSIAKGDMTMFVLEFGRMKDCYCPACADVEDKEDIQPYSAESFDNPLDK